MRGVDSAGMLCSAYDVGWAEEADGVLLQLPGGCEPGELVPAAPMEGSANGARQGKVGKKKKSSSKGGDSVDNAFAALGLDDDKEAPLPKAAKEPSKSKQSRTAVEEAEIDALMAELDAPKPAKASKKKKKGGAKDAGEEEDLDALLAEFGVEVTDTKAEVGWGYSIRDF